MKLDAGLCMLLGVYWVFASGCNAVEGEETERTTGMNRLAGETSAYLLAHADNPVNWYPWGEDAFAAAEAGNKPIFLSIGYSSCHWCHVMEEESFEDAEVAALLNDNYICIKVDREERPDVDNLYMRYTIAMTGGGGWPMTVILTPGGKPFFAATYIPKNDSFGRTGLIRLLPSIALSWETDSDAIVARADEIESYVLGDTQLQMPPGEPSDHSDADLGREGFLAFRSSFDREYGGFGNAPKFPSGHNLLFLLRYWKISGDSEALNMVTETLRAIRRGGVYDQIGFGVHRYSTDTEWLVPHFEKMLYDQALLSLAFLEASQATEDSSFANTASEIYSYILRDMTSPEGAFYSSEDADSEQGEGAFYTWNSSEVFQILSPEDAGRAVEYWNLADEQDSQVIPHLTGNPDPSMEAIRETLLAQRGNRQRPSTDKKILTDWNGLMIASLARASVVLNNPEYLSAAQRSFQFIKQNMTSGSGRLYHSFAGGRKGAEGFLDDYAFLVWGCLELYNATLNYEYLEYAIELQAELDAHFSDASGGGYFFSSDHAAANGHIARLKESYDGAVPSGNSVELTNLITLWKLTGESGYMEAASGIQAAFSAAVSNFPRGYSMMLSGIVYGRYEGTEVLLSGELSDSVLVEMLGVLRAGYRPWTSVMLAEPGIGYPGWVADVQGTSGAAAYVCSNGTCSLPVESASALQQLLDVQVP